MNILQYVITIAEEKNLLKAAQKLYVTPSALSQAISRLEADLHAQLFSRGRTGWEPTEAGELYLNMARNVSVIQEKTILDIHLLNTARSRPIRLGMSAGHNADMLSMILPQFMDRFPNGRITLEERPVTQTLERVAAGALDIGFATSAFPIPGFMLHRLSTERFIIAVPKSDPLSEYVGTVKEGDPFPTAPLSLFRDCGFMCMQEGTTFRTAINEIFRSAGFLPKMIFESSSMQTIRNLAMSGYAVTIMPAIYGKPSEKTTFFFLDTPLLWSRYFAHLPQKTLSLQEEYLLTLSENYYRQGLSGQSPIRNQ